MLYCKINIVLLRYILKEPHTMSDIIIKIVQILVAVAFIYFCIMFLTAMYLLLKYPASSDFWFRNPRKSSPAGKGDSSPTPHGIHVEVEIEIQPQPQPRPQPRVSPCEDYPRGKVIYVPDPPCSYSAAASREPREDVSVTNIPCAGSPHAPDKTGL